MEWKSVYRCNFLRFSGAVESTRGHVQKTLNALKNQRLRVIIVGYNFHGFDGYEKGICISIMSSFGMTAA